MKALVVLLLLQGTAALAASTNPILRLYEERLNLARLELEKLERMKAYVVDRKNVLEDLVTKGAVPERSVLEITRQNGMAVSMEKLLRAQVKQAETLAELARKTLAAGQEMPFCLKD